jgi:hypothetical protein
MSNFGKLALAVGVLAFVATGGVAQAQNKCAGAKIKAACKKAQCILGLEAKSCSGGAPVDPAKLAKCISKYTSTFSKLEAKGGCLTTGDVQDIEDKVDAFVADVDTELCTGGPGGKCAATKIKAAGKKQCCLLGLEAKQASTGDPIDPAKAQKCRDKFAQAFAKADAKGGCDTTGDAQDIEDKVDAFVADADTELSSGGPVCDCCSSTRLTFTTGVGAGTCGSVRDDSNVNQLSLDCGGLYFGGSGVGVPLPSTVPDMGSSVTKIQSCASGSFSIAHTTNTDTGSFRNCTSSGGANPDYPGFNGCTFGPPLPIPNAASAGTSTCVINRVSSNATGSGTCSGTTSLNLPLLSDLYLTGDLLDGSAPNRPNVAGINPCPLCTGPSGSELCQGGPRHGLSCTPGSGDLGDEYPTSHDCPPPGGAVYIGSLPIPFALTTGTATDTSVDLPGQPFVFCGFCGQQFAPIFQGPPAVACTSDAPCTTAPFTKCRQRNPGAFTVGAARTIIETGSPAGCIADELPHASKLVSVFCIPPAFNSTVDAAADLPGPGAVALDGVAQALP